MAYDDVPLRLFTGAQVSQARAGYSRTDLGLESSASRSVSRCLSSVERPCRLNLLAAPRCQIISGAGDPCLRHAVNASGQRAGGGGRLRSVAPGAWAGSGRSCNAPNVPGVVALCSSTPDGWLLRHSALGLLRRCSPRYGFAVAVDVCNRDLVSTGRRVYGRRQESARICGIVQQHSNGLLPPMMMSRCPSPSRSATMMDCGRSCAAIDS